MTNGKSCASIYELQVSSINSFPGVAKFGIALEWGSRGLEFESRHSDQKIVEFIEFHGFFLTFLAGLKPCFLFYLPLVYHPTLQTFLPGIRLYCFSVWYPGGHRYLQPSSHQSDQAIPGHLSVFTPNPRPETERFLVCFMT